jgi:hypothetical protein
MLMVYGLLKFFGGSFGHLALYPITLLVTFLHEFGHAFFAIVTGGGVEGLQINPDGSGYTVTRGGSAAFILMGGYLGSALFGNLLFYIGARKPRITQPVLMGLAVLMAVCGIVWFESFISTGLLFGFAAVLFLIARYTNWDRDVLMFLGLTAALYIIEDFNVGPGSDLAQYESVVGIFPAGIWKFVWLFFAALLFYLSLRRMFKRAGSEV